MRIVLLFLFCVACEHTLGQGQVSDVETIDTLNRVNGIIFTKAEKSPEFPGGMDGWNNFLRENLDPTVGIENGAPNGIYKVIIRFVVTKDGSLANFDAETRFGYGMELEAIRVIQKSPKWIPAIQNNHSVNHYLRQPVTFVVRDETKKRKNKRTSL